MPFQKWLFVCVALTAPPALATTARPVSIEELARQAALVAIATPLHQTPTWEGGRIFTHHTVRLDEVWVGADAALGDELIVHTLGGRVGDLGQAVAGEARLHPGIAVLVFLVPDARLGGYRVLAMEQGALALSADAAQVALPATDHAFSVLRDSAGTSAPTARGFVPVSTLRARVLAARSARVPQ